MAWALINSLNSKILALLLSYVPGDRQLECFTLKRHQHKNDPKNEAKRSDNE
ncbi:hypothetical protein D3C81_1926210 [compost metagenome]